MMTSKALVPILLVPTCIVAIPAVAMLLQVEGWAWSAYDFVLIWVILAAAIAGYKVVASRSPNRVYRIATAVAVVTGILLFWVNAAVGLIGSEDNPMNLMYHGVLAIAVAGVAIARLQPQGLAVAMFVAAAAQFLVPIIAVIVRRPDFSPGVVAVFGLNFGFVLLFATSGILFRHAASASTPSQITTTS